MRIGLLQLAPVVGDFVGNLDRLANSAREATLQGAQLCVAPELALCGYPAHDLLHYPDFIESCEASVREVAALSKALDTAIVVGVALPNPAPHGNALFNAAVVCEHGEVTAIKHKALLPTYDVFDEHRYFEPDPAPCVVEVAGTRVGVLICEDIWTDAGLLGRVDYDLDPAALCVEQGAEILVNLSASPWARDKHALRERLCQRLAERLQRPLVMVNQTGATDELIFDGGSVVIDTAGHTRARLPLFETATRVIDTSADAKPDAWPDDDVNIEIDALTLGVRDYFARTGHSQALVGLSGGIDSALVVCLAARALDPENVRTIGMPTRYSSTGSVDDSRALAEALGVTFDVVNIDAVFESYRKLLENPGGMTEENLQARVRGMVLMAESNRTGALVLATGNRSELAVGYSTLYGDMCGALEVIGDVPKTRVYELSRAFAEMPDAILTKAPSAELRPDQKDSDSLPDYDVLDPVLAGWLDDRKSAQQMIDEGMDADLVARVVRMVEINEYKRRQAPPVLRVSNGAFGDGRRIPIAKRI